MPPTLLLLVELPCLSIPGLSCTCTRSRTRAGAVLYLGILLLLPLLEVPGPPLRRLLVLPHRRLHGQGSRQVTFWWRPKWGTRHNIQSKQTKQAVMKVQHLVTYTDA